MTQKPFENYDEASPEEQDNAAGQAIRHLLDVQYRKQLTQKLEKEYGISAKANKSSRITPLRLRRALLIAASVILIVGAYFIFTGDTQSPQQYAMNLVADQQIAHPGNTKGDTYNIENRLLAIEAYQSKDYPKAATYFSNLSSPTSEDQYFLGLSYLYDKRYTNAALVFQQLTDDKADLEQEARYFLGLSHLLANDAPAATKALNKIKSNDWKYDEAQKLLQLMK